MTGSLEAVIEGQFPRPGSDPIGHVKELHSCYLVTVDRAVAFSASTEGKAELWRTLFRDVRNRRRMTEDGEDLNVTASSILDNLQGAADLKDEKAWIWQERDPRVIPKEDIRELLPNKPSGSEKESLWEHLAGKAGTNDFDQYGRSLCGLELLRDAYAARIVEYVRFGDRLLGPSGVRKWKTDEYEHQNNAFYAEFRRKSYVGQLQLLIELTDGMSKSPVGRKFLSDLFRERTEESFVDLREYFEAETVVSTHGDEWREIFNTDGTLKVGSNSNARAVGKLLAQLAINLLPGLLHHQHIDDSNRPYGADDHAAEYLGLFINKFVTHDDIRSAFAKFQDTSLTRSNWQQPSSGEPTWDMAKLKTFIEGLTQASLTGSSEFASISAEAHSQQPKTRLDGLLAEAHLWDTTLVTQWQVGFSTYLLSGTVIASTSGEFGITEVGDALASVGAVLETVGDHYTGSAFIQQESLSSLLKRLSMLGRYATIVGDVLGLIHAGMSAIEELENGDYSMMWGQTASGGAIIAGWTLMAMETGKAAAASASVLGFLATGPGIAIAIAVLLVAIATYLLTFTDDSELAQWAYDCSFGGNWPAQKKIEAGKLDLTSSGPDIGSNLRWAYHYKGETEYVPQIQDYSNVLSDFGAIVHYHPVKRDLAALVRNLNEGTNEPTDLSEAYPTLVIQFTGSIEWRRKYLYLRPLGAERIKQGSGHPLYDEKPNQGGFWVDMVGVGKPRCFQTDVTFGGQYSAVVDRVALAGPHPFTGENSYSNIFTRGANVLHTNASDVVMIQATQPARAVDSFLGFEKRTLTNRLSNTGFLDILLATPDLYRKRNQVNVTEIGSLSREVKPIQMPDQNISTGE
jgi:hypothetical protein